MIKGIILDLNGTLIDILTDETDLNVYRTTANFLSYYGVYLSAEKLKERYFELNKLQRHESKEQFPEFDVVKIFSDIIASESSLAPKERKNAALNAALTFRAASRWKLDLYPGVKEVLAKLSRDYKLSALTDGQSVWAMPELRTAGLAGYFSSVIVSGDLGFRKPDLRMFNLALEKCKLPPDEVLFVGNDMYRDIYGAHELGIKTVFFRSNQGDHNYHGAEPDYIIYNFYELPKAVEFLAKSGN